MSNVTEKQESLEKSTKKKNPLGSVMFSAWSIIISYSLCYFFYIYLHFYVAAILCLIFLQTFLFLRNIWHEEVCSLRNLQHLKFKLLVLIVKSTWMLGHPFPLRYEHILSFFYFYVC
jgi:hypothetical protein